MFVGTHYYRGSFSFGGPSIYRGAIPTMPMSYVLTMMLQYIEDFPLVMIIIILETKPLGVICSLWTLTLGGIILSLVILTRNSHMQGKTHTLTNKLCIIILIWGDLKVSQVVFLPMTHPINFIIHFYLLLIYRIWLSWPMTPLDTISSGHLFQTHLSGLPM